MEIVSEGAMYSNGRPAGLADVYTKDSSAGDNQRLEPGMRAGKEWPSSETTSAGLQLYEPANTIMEELINE